MIRSLVRSKMAFCLVTKSTALSVAARNLCPVVIVGRFGSVGNIMLNSQHFVSS